MRSDLTVWALLLICIWMERLQSKIIQSCHVLNNCDLCVSCRPLLSFPSAVSLCHEPAPFGKTPTLKNWVRSESTFQYTFTMKETFNDLMWFSDGRISERSQSRLRSISGHPYIFLGFTQIWSFIYLNTLLINISCKIIIVLHLHTQH